MAKVLIPLHEIPHQLEHWLIALKANCFVGVVDGVVIRESVSFLVLEEDARHMACGKWIMVAVASQFSTVQALEVLLFTVDFLKKCKAFVGIGLDILHGIIVAIAA